MVKIGDIETRIRAKGLKKSFIYEQMGISKKTFYSRMKDKEFKPSEVMVLQRLDIV